MYAVIESGGQQHKVSQGSVLRLEKLPGEVGSDYSFDTVLMIADGDNVQLGRPLVSGASVKARIVSHGRGDKVHIIKMKRRKHYRRQMGHRQSYTEVEVLAIEGATSATKSVSAKAPAKQSAATKNSADAKKPAAKKPAAKKAPAASKAATEQTTPSKEQ